jgi:NhaP-type Na+/H+ or K+/H+ antiporter
MDSLAVFVLAAFVLLAVLLSSRLDRGPVTGPLLAVAAGVLAGPALGILPQPTAEHMPARILLELTLVMVLVASGAGVDLRRLRGDLRWALRLVVAIPGMLILGTLAGKLLLPSLSTFEAMILAGIVTPTDDEIRRPAVAGERFPAGLRDALNLEGGLSDGLLVAFLAAALSLAEGEREGGWIALALRQVGLGVAIGVAVGLAGAALLRTAAGRGLVARGWTPLAVPALAVIAYGLGAAGGASGFTAVFCAGAAVANGAPAAREEAFGFAEVEGRLLVLVSFAVFGAIAVVPSLRAASPALVAYALCALIVRAVPVALSLAGSGVQREPAAFAAWFGTRGIACVLFALLLVQRAQLPGVRMIVAAACLTVLASVVLHGATATPWNRRLIRGGARTGTVAPPRRPAAAGRTR